LNIDKDTVVTLDYKVADTNGNVIDDGARPLVYLHGGYDSIFPRVEAELQGKAVGDTCAVTLQPDDAFGAHDETLVSTEPRHMFPPEVAVGMQLRSRDARFPGGVITVTEVGPDQVVIDGNHPLAGTALVFTCAIAGVRQATPAELAHGHVHGEHGHHH
jgi:FKBP-type peptidyl-prolyl cis-trans isomerase SlyD